SISARNFARRVVLVYFSNPPSVCCFINPLLRTSILHQIRQVNQSVPKSGGVLLHEWGNGTADEPWVRVREKARALFEMEGLISPFHPGARLEAEVDSYLASNGFQPVTRLTVGVGSEVTIREFLRRLVDGELSYVWNVPDRVRNRCLPQLQEWVKQTMDMDIPIPIPKHIEWAVYRR
ncbi:MAG TPA: hypothetical protein VMH77_01205, partial [Steroidobacteraceae bacterium]|nr:hypothetical protein [Steroidobacteraceae bacterium]